MTNVENVNVRTSNGTSRRAIHNVCPFTSEENISEDPIEMSDNTLRGQLALKTKPSF